MMLFCFGLAHAGELAERRAYEAAVARATRELRVYDGWYTALLVRGTLVDPDLRAVQASRLEYIRNGASDSAAPPAEADEGIEIVLTASGQWKDELKFAGDGSTAWTVTLYAGGTACAPPEHVVVTKRPGDADRTRFPHLSDWDTMIALHWAGSACGGVEPDVLRLASARGRGELRWAR